MFDEVKNKNTEDDKVKANLPFAPEEKKEEKSSVAYPSASSGQDAMENKKEKEPHVKNEDNAKKELDDIFKDQEGGEQEKPAVFHPRKRTNNNASTTAPQDSRLHKLLIPFVLVFFVSAIIGSGIWAYYRFAASFDLPFLNNDSEEVISEPVMDETDDEEEVELDFVDDSSSENPASAEGYGVAKPENNLSDTENTEEPEDYNKPPSMDNVSIPEVIKTSVDTDQDGLTDQEEIQLGTNINSVDSDNDGLFDLEEVKTYKTNPLLRDTDGDGYMDGAEVKGGYNPNGPGKLYEL